MKFNESQQKLIRELFEEGKSSREIAWYTNLSKSGINYFLNRTGIRNARKPKILFFDLENAPSVVAAFQRWDVNISQDHVITEGSWLISASWKFLDEDEVHGVVLTKEEALEQNDSRIVAELYEAIEKADIVVAHNLKKFDWPLLKTRLVLNGFPPLPTVKLVDTLRIAKGLKFNSNKLDSLGEVLGIGRKIQNSGISLWIKCMEGCTDSLEEMLEYNKGDVLLLEKVYLRLRAWDLNHPNVSMYYSDTETRCPVCGSSSVDETGNSVYTSASEFKELQCGHCGHRSRVRTNSLAKEKRKSFISTAK